MTDRILTRLALTACLVGAAGGSLAQGVPEWAPAPFTQGAMMDFLAQHRCPDGSIPTGCANAPQQRDTDVMSWRRQDWAGQQVHDSVVMSANGAVLATFSYAPFLAADVARGDGGDVYSIEPTAPVSSAVALKTKDGSTAADVDFCGDHWVLFRNDLPVMSATSTGSPGGWWASTTPTIWEGSGSATDCPDGPYPAYTRYREELVSVPFIIFGQPQTQAIPVIVSEHYNRSLSDPSCCQDLERFYFAGPPWGGAIRWEHWSDDDEPDFDNASVCPAVAYSTAPSLIPGARMKDCRHWTNVVAWSDAGFTLSQYGWGWP